MKTVSRKPAGEVAPLPNLTAQALQRWLAKLEQRYLLEHAARLMFDHTHDAAASTTERQGILRMATACWIVIAAFTARRAGEIDDLREGCLRGDAAYGWLISFGASSPCCTSTATRVRRSKCCRTISGTSVWR